MTGQNNNTPLYSALAAQVKRNTLRMHMPGHKGKACLPSEFGSVASIDFTEVPGTGDLYAGTPPVSTAEELAAKTFGAGHCSFLTGGSTQGMLTALALCCPMGSRLLVDRGSHRSVYNAMAILDLQPTYLYSEYLDEFQITMGISPQAVRNALKKDPRIKTVCITSPTYYGVLSDIPAIAAAAREAGARLVVDEAHGAHLPFLLKNPCAQGLGADVSVMSAHKTLPALGSGALLFTSGEFKASAVRRTTALFGTSSPSYPVMASIDWVRGYMEKEGGTKYRDAARAVAILRKQINERGVFTALLEKEPLFRQGQYPALDPTRLVINTGCAGLSGYQAATILDEVFGIVCEMADEINIVCIATCADSEDDFERLGGGLFALADRCMENRKPQFISCPPPLPCRKVSLRKAVFEQTEACVLRNATGRIAAETIAPYPPGIPVIAPGEEINEKNLAYLSKLGYNIDRKKEVIRER